ncbi:MAG: Flp pilus assembly protein CpaB [Gammaproteobacteria bacterium]|nr:Flp pilus assembly protein CpaB [Gammaproteobacteria bacterium]
MAFPRVRREALLAIAALAGLLISLVLIYTVERRAAVTTVPVLVVTKSVAKGTTLEASMVEVKQWPAHGRLARIDLFAGEPLLNAKLRQRGERGDLNDQLGVGERALSIRVNDIVGVPVDSILGQHVDLLLTQRVGDAAASSLPVAERVRVLAVNNTGSADRPQPIRMLTLAVTPAQATAIEESRSTGTLTALVRNPRDRRMTTAPAAAPSTSSANGEGTDGARAVERPAAKPLRCAHERCKTVSDFFGCWDCSHLRGLESATGREPPDHDHNRPLHRVCAG